MRLYGPLSADDTIEWPELPNDGSAFCCLCKKQFNFGDYSVIATFRKSRKLAVHVGCFLFKKSGWRPGGGRALIFFNKGVIARLECPMPRVGEPCPYDPDQHNYYNYVMWMRDLWVSGYQAAEDMLTAEY